MACSAGWRQGPFWVMGAAAVASGALCVLLPETLGAPQPDTLADVERNARRPQAALRYQVGAHVPPGCVGGFEIFDGAWASVCTHGPQGTDAHILCRQKVRVDAPLILMPFLGVSYTC